MVRLAIVGSRNFTDQEFFNECMSKFVKEYGSPTKIISGGARGADTLAEEYAKREGIILTIHNPDWELHGKSAGPIRNALIVKDCNIVLAFPSKNGRGTQDTIKKANDANKKVVIHWVQ